LQRPQLTRPANSTSPVPWRRANVRHTSNELYVDIVETLSVIVAPSGRQLAALAAGNIAFTSKVSGVPDLVLLLTAPGGINNTLSLPVFHPCVRLQRWREKAGELSFVPPDGRFLLASYEVNLLEDDPETLPSITSKQPLNLNLPVSLEVETGVGPAGTEFKARLMIWPRFNSSTGPSSASASNAGAPSFSRSGIGGRSTSAFTAGGTSAHPILEQITVRIPIPTAVRNVMDLRASRGDAQYAPGDAAVEWTITTKEIAAIIGGSHGAGGTSATLVGTPVGLSEEAEEGVDNIASEAKGDKWEYNEAEDENGSYQASADDKSTSYSNKIEPVEANATAGSVNKSLMPSSATVSFQVKGWLASGIRVDSLLIDTKKSRGLGAGVTPYKGVKYLTVSKNGVEIRC
jgi:AP-3 complex subunit mu